MGYELWYNTVISVSFTLSFNVFIPNFHNQLKCCNNMNSFWTAVLPSPLFVSYLIDKYLLALWSLKTITFHTVLHAQ